MQREVLNIQNKLIQTLMVVRMQDIQRNDLPTLDYDDLEAYLEKYLWKSRTPVTISQAANDILHVNANDLVRFMSTQAVKAGASGKLSDFMDILGGKEGL